MSTGIDKKLRKVVADDLAAFLADTYGLYLKTQNFHWNVTGPLFHSLHAMFEMQYTELATAIDEIAERIRALGEFAPGSYAQFSQLTSIKEVTDVPKAEAMVKQLIVDHESIINSGRDIIGKAEEARDAGTADMLTARLEAHEKTVWMLSSVLA